MTAARPPDRPPEELGAFGAYVREFLSSAGLAPAADRPLDVYVDPPVGRAFQRHLHDAGLAGLEVPRHLGGAGLTTRHSEVFAEEAAAYTLPSVLFAVTIGMCVPLLLATGTEEQCASHLPAMLRGDEIWCQMFSEPEAGSDLAGLHMRAVRDGDEWVLDGQKVWTSAAHYADMAVCAARTDPAEPRHRGISLFIIPLPHPAIEVRPLVLMTGDARFNEVFCNGARLPADRLLGPLHDGWRGITTMLRAERLTLGASNSSLVNGLARQAGDAATQRGVAADPLIRQAVAERWAAEVVLGRFSDRVRAMARPDVAPGPEGSLAKVMASRHIAASAALRSRVAGAHLTAAEPDDHDALDVMRAVLHAPSMSIAGGTTEIQRNIIGERGLGLPREITQ